MKYVDDLEQLGRMRMVLQQYLREVRVLAPDAQTVHAVLEDAICGLETIAEDRLNLIREAGGEPGLHGRAFGVDRAIAPPRPDTDQGS